MSDNKLKRVLCLFLAMLFIFFELTSAVLAISENDIKVNNIENNTNTVEEKIDKGKEVLEEDKEKEEAKSKIESLKKALEDKFKAEKEEKENEDIQVENEDLNNKPDMHIITFNSDGGSGEMKSIKVKDSRNFILPKNRFKAPGGKEFKFWVVEDKEYQEEDSLIVTRDLEVKAKWEDIKTNLNSKTMNKFSNKEKNKISTTKTSSSIDNKNNLEISEDLNQLAATSDDPRYALFKNEPELLKNGDVDLSTEEEKAQGKFNKITSIKMINYIQDSQQIYDIKISGRTNMGSTKKIFFGNFVQGYKVDETSINKTGTDNEIIRDLKVIKDGNIKFYQCFEIGHVNIDITDNFGKNIGTLSSGNDYEVLKINKLPKEVKEVNYEIILSFILNGSISGLGVEKGSSANVETNIYILNLDEEPTFNNYITKGRLEKYEYDNKITISRYSERVDFVGKVNIDKLEDKDLEPELYYSYIRLDYDNKDKEWCSRLLPRVYIPRNYITKDNAITYSAEINTKDFEIKRDVNIIKNGEYRKTEYRTVYAKEPAYIRINNVRDMENAQNNNNFYNTYHNVYMGNFENIFGADVIIKNFQFGNGKISYTFYNDGEDKRSGRFGYSKSLTDVFPGIYNSSKLPYLKLKNLNLIQEDGSYKIPYYTYTIMRHGKVLKKDTVYIQGKINIPSGKSFSDLYEIENKLGLVEEKDIPIEEQRIPNKTMLIGEEKIIQEGEVGKERTIYDAQYLNGEEYSRSNEKTEIIKPMKPKIIHYGTADKLVNKTTEIVKYDTIYEADETLNYGENKTTQQGKNGSKEITTTTIVVDGKRQESKDEVVTVNPTPEIINVGNKKVDEEKLPFKTIEEIDKTLKEGEAKIKVKGAEGLKTTTTIYEVDKKTGKLINPKETVTTKDPVDQIILKGTKPDPIKTSIKAKVKYFGVSGTEEKPETSKYKFVLKDSEGKVVSEATNDGNGNIVFEELNITDQEIGSHKYTVEQIKGDDPTIEYDTHVEDVTVDVSLSDDNKLSAKVTYDKDGAVFINKSKIIFEYPVTGLNHSLYTLTTLLIILSIGLYTSRSKSKH